MVEKNVFPFIYGQYSEQFYSSQKNMQNVKNENLRLRNFMINLASQLANQSDSYFLPTNK